MESYDIKSMLDIGCGPGGMIELAQLRGIDAFGIDGDFTIDYSNEVRPFVFIHDFILGPAPIEGEFDLAWSVEFLEHVDEKYIPNYMDAFRMCKYAVVTAAPPGWTGHHHVNLQPQEYWENKFGEYGFEIDRSETEEIRKISSMQKGFMARTGMFFRRIP
jgi:SAM-dependent methyltransferase